MKLSLSILLLAGVATAEGSEPTHYVDYGKAYRAAKQSGRPLLVILNPGSETVSKAESISIEAVRKTEQRRKLLEDYVVAVIDTGTKPGSVTHRSFKSPALPRVVVIDKRQRFQIFQSSEKLYGQLWTTILETYRSGERPVQPARRTVSQARYRSAYQLQRSRAYCPT